MRPTVVMLAGLGLLYLLYTGRAEAVLSALSSGGSGGTSGGSSGGTQHTGNTTAPVKGYKSLPNSQKCPSGYKWDASRETCVKQ